jgi:hypothetical protein
MDKELQQIGWLLKLLNAFEGRMYKYCFEDKAKSVRIRRYIVHRYRHFFEWINEEGI